MNELTAFPHMDVDDDDLTDAQILEKYPVNYIGPTWQRNEDGSFKVPKYSLGWEIAAWCAEYLRPLGVGQKAFTFTNEQFRFLLWWYAVDENGAWVYNEAILQRIKGWGKDPLLAVLCLVEAFGPARFDQFRNGIPLGKRAEPEAWVQVYALSAEQTRNTANMFPILISDKLKKHAQIKPGIEIIRGFEGSAQIELKTASWRSSEGGRATFTLMNEALDVDTLIPVPAGVKRMGDLVVGDTVYSETGVPVSVVEATPVQVGRDCYKVSIVNHCGVEVDSVVASDGHLWESKVASSAAKPKVRSTAEMVTDGRMFMVPRAEPVRRPDRDLPVDPYLLGYWLGDGSTGDCNITVGDEDVEEFLAQMELRGIEFHELKSVGRARRFGFSNKRGFGAGMGTDLALRFRALPCYRSKFIPDEFMHAGDRQRLDLLRGLMDSDGCATKGGLAVFVGRERLANDVRELALSLGFLPTVSFAPDPRSREGGSWRVVFKIEGLNPFTFPRKASVGPVPERRKWVSVRFEKVESRPVRCIAVDSGKHLFQASNGIVTHNTQHWLSSNGGHQLAETIRNNAEKQGRVIAITNAPEPGEESIAELDRRGYEGAVEGRLADRKVLYDSVEAADHTPLVERVFKLVFERVRGDAVWRDPHKAWLRVTDTAMKVTKARRMYLNQMWQPEGSLYTPDELACIRSDQTLQLGDRIVLGFDGGKSDDATALVAIRIRDGLIVPLFLAEKPELVDEWSVDVASVEAAVHRAFRDYRVVGFFADIAYWETQVQAWGEDYGRTFEVLASNSSPVGWDMRNWRRATRLHEQFMAAILDRVVAYGPDPYGLNLDKAFSRHVMNTQRRDNTAGVSFMKRGGPESKRKIDLYAAAMLAYAAYMEVRMKDALRADEAPKGWSISTY